MRKPPVICQQIKKDIVLFVKEAMANDTEGRLRRNYVPLLRDQVQLDSALHQYGGTLFGMPVPPIDYSRFGGRAVTPSAERPRVIRERS